MPSPRSFAEAAIQGDDIPLSTRTDQPQTVCPQREDEHSDQSSSNGEREMVATTALPVPSSYDSSTDYNNTTRPSTPYPNTLGDSRRGDYISPSTAPMPYHLQHVVPPGDTIPAITDGTPTVIYYGADLTNPREFIIQKMTSVSYTVNQNQTEGPRRAEEYEKWRKEEEDERWRRAEKAVQKLDEKRIQGAMLDSEERGYVPRCNEDTRQSLRRHIVEWGQMDAVIERLLWLSGPAGVGKSAVAQTVAEEMGRLLGAVFFFSRPNNRSDPSVVIPTLVYQLAMLLPEYKLIVGQQFKEDPSIFGKSRHSQFEKLISDPFVPDLSRPLTLLSYLSEQLLTSLFHRPLLIVLDGLDECDGLNAQREFVEMIAYHAQKDRDSRLRWMICSRPEPHLTSVFSSADCRGIYRHERLEVDDGEAQKDALRILRKGFADIRERYSDQLAHDWPHVSHIDFIAERASGHLGFASFIIRYIGDPEYGGPSHQLDTCLKFLTRTGDLGDTNPLRDLDCLYTQIFSDIPAATLPTTQLILGLFILYGNERLTALVHANFLGLDQATFYHSLRRLYSVVQVPLPSDSSTQPIQIYHASFSDYLRNKARAGKFVLDEGAIHLYVATRGLEWLGHCRKEPSAQQALPNLTWPEDPTSPHSWIAVDSVCNFVFTPCWRAFPQVPEASLSTLIEALKDFDFNITYSKWGDEVREFAYFIQWLVSSDAKSLALVDRKHPNKPGKKEEVAIIWNDKDPPTFAKPFFDNASHTDHLSIHLQLRTRTQTSFHLITSTDIKDMCQLREDDILIAFMGPTGSGKTHYIKLLTGRYDRRFGHTLMPETLDILATRARHSEYGDRVVLVDTPGFGDTDRSDMETLMLISNWLVRTYKNNIKLSGIIYLHCITDYHMAYLSVGILQLFEDLCGDHAAARVIIVSTMWEEMDANEGNLMEDVLKNGAWRCLIERGSKVDRLNKSKTREAWRVVDRLIETNTGGGAVLLLQEEIVGLKRKLHETKAGQGLLFYQKKSIKSRLAQKWDDPRLKADLKKEYKKVQEQFNKTFEVNKTKVPIWKRLMSFFLPRNSARNNIPCERHVCTWSRQGGTISIVSSATYWYNSTTPSSACSGRTSASAGKIPEGVEVSCRVCRGVGRVSKEERDVDVEPGRKLKQHIDHLWKSETSPHSATVACAHNFSIRTFLVGEGFNASVRGDNPRDGDLAYIELTLVASISAGTGKRPFTWTEGLTTIYTVQNV
ncbi:hypothetical protein D9756_009607 [Leucocoprinus leucothites]|uniref:AAA+ ATPase domain-containing protein n=1 Tax=Leucocoprinus leucothites TaxID=201217 RepID=A0A8H5FTD3_9AGAR|nr:hypothetical protein D9756_009607 [Leucoagaricus leucothites]